MRKKWRPIDTRLGHTAGNTMVIAMLTPKPPVLAVIAIDILVAHASGRVSHTFGRGGRVGRAFGRAVTAGGCGGNEHANDGATRIDRGSAVAHVRLLAQRFRNRRQLRLNAGIRGRTARSPGSWKGSIPATGLPPLSFGARANSPPDWPPGPRLFLVRCKAGIAVNSICELVAPRASLKN